MENFKPDLLRAAARFPSLLNYVLHVYDSSPHGAQNNKHGGSEEEQQLLRRAVLDDPETACNFCYVHTQDYVCLGYELPAECGACPPPPKRFPSNLQVSKIISTRVPAVWPPRHCDTAPRRPRSGEAISDRSHTCYIEKHTCYGAARWSNVYERFGV